MRLPFRTQEKSVVALSMPWANGIAMSPPRNYRTFALEAFSRSPLVYACIMVKAQSTSDISLKVQQRIGKEWVDADDLSQRTAEGSELQNLLDNPNPHQDQTQWLSDTIVCQDVAGNSYTQVELSKTGRPVALWHLPRPDAMMVVPDDTKLISGYVYNPGGQPHPLDAAEIIHFRHPGDPLNPLLGMSPLVTIARELDADGAATDFLKQFFDKGGVPALAAIFKGVVSEADSKKFRRDFERQFSIGQGGNAAGGLAIVNAKELEFQKLGSTTGSREMGLQEIRQVIEARICSVLRVHPQIAFTLIGFVHPTYAQAKVAEEAQWQMGNCPMYTRLAGTITVAMRPYYPNCRVVPDFSKVAALAEDQDALWQRHMTAVSLGIETREEARAALQMPANPDGVFLVPSGVQEQVPGEPLNPPPAPVPAALAAADADPAAPPEPEPPAKPKPPKLPAKALAFKANSAKAKRHAAAMEALRRRIAGEIEPKLADYFAGLSERVTHRLRAQDGKALWLLMQTKQGYPFDEGDLLPKGEDQRLNVILTPLWLDALESGWQATASEWGLEASFSVTNPEVERLLRSAAAERVVNINTSTRDKLREALANGAQQGYSISQLVNGVPADNFTGIKELIEQTYEGRARTIAYSESMWASGMGSIALMKSEEIDKAELIDGDFDAICQERNGKVVSVDEAEQELNEEHPNGNLVVAPVVSGAS